MNKQGFVNPAIVFVGIMIAFVAFVMLVALISPVKSFVDVGRSYSDGLNCEGATDYNSSATTDELTCLIIDIWLPAFFGTALAIAIAYVGMTKLRKKEEQ